MTMLSLCLIECFYQKEKDIIMIKDIYEQMFDFHGVIEKDYEGLFKSQSEWDSFHFKFLIYYLVRYNVSCSQYFIHYHYRTAYRLYLERLLMTQGFVTC